MASEHAGAPSSPFHEPPQRNPRTSDASLHSSAEVIWYLILLHNVPFVIKIYGPENSKKRDFHQKFDKKPIQIKIFKISGSSLFILKVLQGQILLGAMMCPQILVLIMAFFKVFGLCLEV